MECWSKKTTPQNTTEYFENASQLRAAQQQCCKIIRRKIIFPLFFSGWVLAGAVNIDLGHVFMQNSRDGACVCVCVSYLREMHTKTEKGKLCVCLQYVVDSLPAVQFVFPWQCLRAVSRCPDLVERLESRCPTCQMFEPTCCCMTLLRYATLPYPTSKGTNTLHCTYRRTRETYPPTKNNDRMGVTAVDIGYLNMNIWFCDCLIVS